MQDKQGIEVVELHGEGTQEVLAHSLAADLELQPAPETEQERIQRLLGSPYVLSLRNAAERRCVESERIREDLAINRMKNSGDMLRREIDRVRMAEMNAGVHQ